METVIEHQRRCHEERERIEDAMTQELLMKKSNLKEQINSDHRVRFLLERYMEITEKLKKYYADEDALRQEEIVSISGPNEFAEFYGRLRTIKQYHRKYPNEIAEPMQMEFLRLKDSREKAGDDQDVLVEFSDEEGFGKYLDLHEPYNLYINLKNIEQIDYLTYLVSFDRLFEIPKERKNHEYKKYLNKVLDYLYNFLQRGKPILNLEKELQEAMDDFNSKYESGNFMGWPKETGSALAHSGAHLDLSAFSSVEELMSLGLDRLKSALQALSMKCGGSLEQRAKRLFGTKGVSLDKLQSSTAGKGRGGKSKGVDSAKRQKEIASLEAQVYRLVELVSEERQATRENVERKQARTANELEDDEEDHALDEESDDEEEQVLYNPKKLPLGWDGKPIPYWLYKLHGLNLYYPCEICGNQKYRGPKAFQRHFSEWRHAHGMRVLNIPNTAHFANVTKIEDALSLWEKLKEEKAKERFQPENDEEFEDSVGNVVNKKTYEDLSRQGLL